jgi:hypothetical protein
MLYHVSEQPDIARFDPRPAPDPSSGQTGLMVWAIDDAHLHNYLLPRDCPRVTFYARPDSHPNDVARLLGHTTADYVVAIEAAWFERVLSQTLYLYAFAPEPFTMIDAGAGYHISREPIVPQCIAKLDNLPTELFRRHVELRVMPSLWPLRDAVVASSLQFSMIRMRNAGPRTRDLRI